MEDNMSVFTRFRDIVSSNINAMLDNTEDPEKMIRLMISEMEDTLIDIKRSCAGAMANVVTVQRQASDTRSREQEWESKAELAVENGRDDLAREALTEKRRYMRRADSLERELQQLDAVVCDYKSDMSQLEEKLKEAREKRRVLIQRHIHARRKRSAEESIRCVDSAEAVLKFEQLKGRIDRMEAEADLVNYGRTSTSCDRFDSLMASVERDAIEAELQALKGPRYGRSESRPSY